MSLISSRRPVAAVVATVLAACVGCGGPTTAEVTGKLTLNGQAPQLAGLHISFMGKDGKPVSSEVALDGTYRLEEVPVGDVQVALIYSPTDPNLSPEAIERAFKPTNPDVQPKPPKTIEEAVAEGTVPVPPQPKFLPERLQNHRTSGLEYKVEAGKVNTIDVNAQL